MKGLIIKDLYQMAKYCRSYLIILLVFLTASTMNTSQWFFLFYPCLLCGMIPVTLLAYDERSHWNQYALTLPVSRKEIVTGKYLIGIGTILVTLLISMAISALGMVKAGSFSVKHLMSLAGTIFMAAALTSSITLPFMFKLGVEKGRVIYYVVIGAMTALVFLLSNVIPSVQEETAEAAANAASLAAKIPAVIPFLIGIAAIVISRILSVKFYEKRELR